MLACLLKVETAGPGPRGKSAQIGIFCADGAATRLRQAVVAVLSSPRILIHLRWRSSVRAEWKSHLLHVPWLQADDAKISAVAVHPAVTCFAMARSRGEISIIRLDRMFELAEAAAASMPEMRWGSGLKRPAATTG